jgi:integrase
MALTVKQIHKLLQEGKPGRYRDSRNLFLKIRAPWKASWVYRFEKKGRKREEGLGAWPIFTLEEARDARDESRKKRRAGVDPIAAKASEKAARANDITLKDATLRYLEDNRAKWSKKYSDQFLASFERYVFPLLGKMFVREIITNHILGVLEQRHEGTTLWRYAPKSTSELRGRMENVLDWASVRGFRSGDNCARWRGHIDKILPHRRELRPVEPYAALPYSHIARFVSELRLRESVSARALEFAILCGGRTGEVVGARWDEIDFDQKLWVIPATRMKAKQPHRVPLCSRAIEILKALPREADNPHVFISPAIPGKGLGKSALKAVITRMGVRNSDNKLTMYGFPLTVHGFRSTFRTWGSEVSGYSHDILEYAIAHVVGNKVSRAYNRTDLLERRRPLMEDWLRFCEKPAAPVVPIPVDRRSARR